MPNVNKEQVRKVAEVLKNLPDDGGYLNFYSIKKGDQEVVLSDMYPELNHPDAINFFFFAAALNFGFWYGDKNGYVAPIFGSFAGKKVKGSDLLWKVLKRVFDKDPKQFEPQKFSNISPEDFAKLFSDDNGPIPFPDWEARFSIAISYGKWFLENKISPVEIVERTNRSSAPLNNFLIFETAQIPGYDKDRLFFKKNILLAMVLANRPEQFLKIPDYENWPPIIDYHLMRVGLRLGLVELAKTEEATNKERRWVSGIEEFKVRNSIFDANKDLITLSGKPMKFSDKVFWLARKYCPEMEKPDCAKCVFDSVCKKRIELFQPVLRGTNY